MNTSCRKEAAMLEKKHPGNVVFVDRETHLMVTKMPDLTKKRHYVGLSNDRIGQQEQMCACDGCRSEVGGIPQCLNDDVSGRSRRLEKAISRKEGVAYKVTCFENRQDATDQEKIVEKEIRRTLVPVEKWVVGDLMFQNITGDEKKVERRALVVFKAETGGQVGWVAGVVKEIRAGELVAYILCKQRGATDTGEEKVVKMDDVLLTSDACPARITNRIDLCSDTKDKLKVLI